jgi:mycofactocin system FadH/OYE family oxidoreductase 1
MAGTALTDHVVLAGRRAPSRVLFGPHETNLGQGRAISERHVAYYARRSAGGTGVLVTETASVHDTDWPYERAPLAQDCPPGWAAVAVACKDQGTLVLAGLGHTGAQGSTAFSQQALWAPSRVADAASREMPVAMEPHDIDLLVAGFVRAARLAVDSGLAGVEIDAGVGALLRQFHSGLTNLRDDSYGQDRLMLTREILSAVRDEIGRDVVLSLRLSCDELAPWAGVTPEMALEQVRVLAPLLDLLVVVQGGPFTASAYRPDAHAPAGHTIELCRQISVALDGALPVVLQGGVVDPDMAQSALDDGVADLVEMTRALIADADLVAKVRAGTAVTVRPCVRCNQTCRVRDNRNPVVTCIGDPRSGHETVDVDVEGTTSHEAQGHRVLVVGAGPAGLECARVLAGRGASVRAVDAADRAGGMLPVVAAGRQTFGDLSDWLVSECNRLGVSVVLGSRLSLDDIRAALSTGQSVVLATGSRPSTPRYKIQDGANVVTATDLLHAASRGTLSEVVGPGSRVLVDDPVGGPVGVAVVELLARHGHQVSIVTQDQIVGTGLSLSGDLADANARLQRAGVVRVLSSVLREVTVDGAVIEQRWTREQRVIPTDLVVDAGHRLAEGQPYDALVDADASLRNELVRAGDCVAPRTVHEAILEGRRAALTVLSRVATSRSRTRVRLEAVR